MGRRSINTTKSGKYMNPTDQARKEARKRELKKNKKQRQMVRAAVLKGKDPAQIIMEMDKMDIIEFNVENQATLSEKVLKEKRKKLRETLDRVLKLYEKENPEYWVEIRRMEAEYDKKRVSRVEYYEAVRHAQAVTIEDIPLPNLDMPPIPSLGDKFLDQAFDTMNVPNAHLLPSHSILKKNQASHISSMEPPGCPPALPEDLSESEDDLDDEDITEKRVKTIRFADSEGEEKDSRLSTKKSKSLPEDDEVVEDDNDEVFPEKPTKSARFEDEDSENARNRDKKSENLTSLQSKLLQMSGHSIAPSGMLPGVPPPPLMLRPPPRPGIPIPPGMRMPPVPPPQGLMPRLPNMRLPPPMGMRLPMRPGILPPGMSMRGPPPGINPNVLTAGPQLIVRPKDDDKKNSATIEAKPQIRNLCADVTRFLPTSLRVKRDDKRRLGKMQDPRDLSAKPEETDRRPTKDDAYSQFMKEMEDLL